MDEKRSGRLNWDVPNERSGLRPRGGVPKAPNRSGVHTNSRAQNLDDSADVGHAFASSGRGGRPMLGGNRFASALSNAPTKEDGSWMNRGGRRSAPEKEQDIFSSTKEKTVGINFDSYDNIQVEISGNRTEEIKPLNSFKEAGTQINSKLMANIERVQYDKPTPVQKYAIPIILAGRDLMACAQTGSGKTAAFLFPIIIRMLGDGPPQQKVDRRSEPVALVISPTRELTCQIATESRKFAFQTGIRTVVVYGGAEVKNQIYDLGRGCDICVATPGRLNDLMERGRVSLASISYLVLDEADRMLDMGFAPQIQDIVIHRDMPKERQTAMFSATFPREIQQLAANFMRDYVYLTVGRVGSTSEFITQKFLYAEEIDKPKRLLQVLNDAQGRVLVFVETKRKADLIEQFLNQKGLKAISIHGDRTQGERTSALDMFKKGVRPILVATDVAARGLDIHSITWVINLDLPHNIEDYVHRIGRTGRAGNNGLATSFVNESNKTILRDLHRLLEEANQEVPGWFIDLTRVCSATNTKGFGTTRYGNRGVRGVNFGGQDYRQFGNDGLRRNYNAAGRNSNQDSSFGARRQMEENADCW